MKTRLSRHKKGNLGGYLIGKKHKNGGIPLVNKSNPNQKIEVEGGEVIITAPAVTDNKVRTLSGTNREILSQINVSGGGVSFAKGGAVPRSIRCTGRKYKYGGKTMSDYDIVSSCGCKHSKKMEDGGDVDIYDEMDEQFPGVKETMKKVKDFLIKNGYDIQKEHEPDYDTDGSLELSNTIHVSVSLDNTFNVVAEQNGLFKFFPPITSLLSLQKQIEAAKASERRRKSGNKKKEQGGPVDPVQERQDQILAAIKTIQASPKHPMYNYTQDPVAFLAFIQEQATGLNPDRTEVQLLKGATPKMTFDATVKLVGSEELVLASIEILPDDVKEILKYAWALDTTVPLKLRRAILPKDKLFKAAGGELSASDPQGLTPDQVWVLMAYKVFKPPFRKDNIAAVLEKDGKYSKTAKQKTEQLIQGLKDLGFITPQNALSDKGRQAVEDAKSKYGLSSSYPFDRDTYEKWWLSKFPAASMEQGGSLDRLDTRVAIPVRIHTAGDRNSAFYQSFKTGGIFAKGGPVKKPGKLALTQSRSAIVPKTDLTPAEFMGLIKKISPFVPDFQIKYLLQVSKGEEKQFAFELVQNLLNIIETMPATYGTEKQETDDKIVYLHYFYGGSDWYIVEKDKGSKDDPVPGVQHQAFGYAILNGDLYDAEWGYISIEEIRQTEKIELDFYFDPQPFREVKKKWVTEETEESKEDEGPEYEFVGGKGNSLDLVKFSSYKVAQEYLDKFFAKDLLRDYEVLMVYPEWGLVDVPEGYYLSKYRSIGKDYKDKGTYLNKGAFESNLNMLKGEDLPAGQQKEIKYQEAEPEVIAVGDKQANEQLKKLSSYKDKSVTVAFTKPQYKKYLRLEENNQHSENAQFLAGLSGDPVLMEASEVLVKNHLTVGHLTEPLKELQYKLYRIFYLVIGEKTSDQKLATYRQANKKEREIIIEKWGEELLPAIEQVLGDVIELNPFDSRVRLSAGFGDIDTTFSVIGASANKEKNNYFYIMTDDGKIYLEHNFSLFPEKDKEKKIEESPVIYSSQQSTTSVKKQVEINKQIRDLVKAKGDKRSAYSPEELALLELYEGAGFEKKTSADPRILDQFFTPMDICAKMWGLAFKHGFTWGKSILEPAVGTGRFLKFIPADSKSYVRAYDVDETTYTISKVLYPKFDIRHKSFEAEFFKGRRHVGLAGIDQFFDLVIGNPPYREYVSEYAPLGEKDATGAFTFEMYFIARGIDVLKPGGLLVYVIPNTFMSNDNKYNEFKENLSKKCKIIDGYRLPNGVFGNTEVGTDIIVLRKND